eukprot:gene22311-biopygen5735
MKWRRRRCGKRYIWEHFEAFSEYFGIKTTKIASKDAPQRRVYARSPQKGPIDGTHGRVPSMVHMGVHKKCYFQFPPGSLLDRAHARKMRFSSG